MSWKATLIISLPSSKDSKLVRFALRAGAQVYFLPGFLAERRPSTCERKQNPLKTGRRLTEILRVRHFPPQCPGLAIPGSLHRDRSEPTDHSDPPSEQGSWVKLQPSSPPAFQKQGSRREAPAFVKRWLHNSPREEGFRFNR